MNRLQTCCYSGYKIYPGRGKTFVRTDGRVHVFVNSKCNRSLLMGRSAQKVTWTTLYRRKHRKGQYEDYVKKKGRRVSKFPKPVAGSSVSEILAKRNMQPMVRQMDREEAIKQAKERKRAKKQQKTHKSPTPATAALSSQPAAGKVHDSQIKPAKLQPLVKQHPYSAGKR